MYRPEPSRKWEFTQEFHVNMGLGFDLGSNGPGLVLKSRLEWDWDKRRQPSFP
jgi:hypothetical protein